MADPSTIENGIVAGLPRIIGAVDLHSRPIGHDADLTWARLAAETRQKEDSVVPQVELDRDSSDFEWLLSVIDRGQTFDHGDDLQNDEQNDAPFGADEGLDPPEPQWWRTQPTG
jgi:hypothetical protein